MNQSPKLLVLVLMIWLMLASIILRNYIREPTQRQRKNSYIRRLINNSGVYAGTRNYNSLMHIILSLVLFVTSYNLGRFFLGNVSSVIFSVLAAMIPTIILNILSQNKISKTRIATMEFIDVFSNQMITHTNIFDAMSEAVKYAKDPVKRLILESIHMYNKKIPPDKCLEHISKNLSGIEAKSFFENLKFYFIEGGDITTINEDYMEELTSIIEIDREEDSEDRILATWIYIIIIINLGGILTSLKSDLSSMITQTVYGEVALSVNFAICIALVMKVLTKQGEIQ